VRVEKQHGLKRFLDNFSDLITGKLRFCLRQSEASKEGEQDKDKTESVPEWRDTTVPLPLSFKQTGTMN
jgi:hypothetical protein